MNSNNNTSVKWEWITVLIKNTIEQTPKVHIEPRFVDNEARISRKSINVPCVVVDQMINPMGLSIVSIVKVINPSGLSPDQ